MSDKNLTESPADASADLSRPRPVPGAHAASRARRIGGSPTPGRRPAPVAPTTPVVTETPQTVAIDAELAVADMPTVVGSVDASVVEASATPTWLRWLPATVLGLLAAALAVLLLVQVVGNSGKTAAVSSRDAVLSAAKGCTAALASYDYRKLDQATQAGLACATGTFKSQYGTSMKNVVGKIAPQQQAVVTFQVANAGVESSTSDGKQMVVLVYGQQSVTNKSTGSTPRLDVLSARVTMTKVGGKWLVSGLTQA